MIDLIEQLILDLKSSGVTVFFGVQGGACARIIDKVVKSELEFIPVLNEQAAGYAAHGYFLANNKPAGVIVTTGPGLTNCISGIASCYYDNIPVVLLIGQIKGQLNLAKTFQTKMYGFQELPHLDIVKPTCDVVIKINSYEDFISNRSSIINHMINLDSSLAIEIQDDIQRLQIDKLEDREYDLGRQDISKIITSNNYIETDLIVLGAGSRYSLSTKIIENINKTNIPVIFSWGAQHLSHNFKNSKGLFGNHSPGVGNIYMKNCENPIVVGCSLLQHQIGRDVDLFMPKSKNIIFINNDKNEIKRAKTVFSTRINPLLLDAKDFFKIFKFNNTSKIKIENEDSIQKLSSVPSVLSDILIEFSKLGTFVFTDAGATLSWSFQSLNIKKNWSLKVKMYSSFNLHPMGFSNCALVGSGINNENYNLAIIGDGSLPMNSQELSHMSKFPNLKIIVVDNNGYGIIRNTQDDYYGGKHFGSSFKDLSPLPKYDPKKILDSFNLNGKTINSHQYDKEDIVSFFKSKDQYLILDVDDNSELLTDYYGIN